MPSRHCLEGTRTSSVPCPLHNFFPPSFFHIPNISPVTKVRHMQTCFACRRQQPPRRRTIPRPSTLRNRLQFGCHDIGVARCSLASSLFFSFLVLCNRCLLRPCFISLSVFNWPTFGSHGCFFVVTRRTYSAFSLCPPSCFLRRRAPADIASQLLHFLWLHLHRRLGGPRHRYRSTGQRSRLTETRHGHRPITHATVEPLG